MKDRILDRLVRNMNETLAFNTKKYETVFTTDRRFFTVPHNDFNALSNCSIYRIYLKHKNDILIFEEHYIPEVVEESDSVWEEVEERVIRTLANCAVMGSDNLVEQSKRVRDARKY